MKKLIALMLCIIFFTTSLTGCGGNTTAPEAESENEQTETEAPALTDTERAEDTETPESGTVKNVLSIRRSLSDLERNDDGSIADPFPYETTRAPFWCAVSENGGKLYLLGTIHVGDLRTASVLSRLDETLAKCDALVVEVDVTSEKEQKDSAVMLTSEDEMTYDDGTTVKDHVPEELYLKMRSFLENRGMYDELMDKKNLSYWYWKIFISLIYETSALNDGVYIIDQLIAERANELGIPVEQMESSSEQNVILDDAFDTIPEDTMLSAIEATLDYTDEMTEVVSEYFFDAMDDWYERDEAALLESTKEKSEINEILLGDRNVNMADRAIEYIESGKTVFIAVGVAHMLGDTGIVQSLRRAGYTVRNSRLVDPVY